MENDEFPEPGSPGMEHIIEEEQTNARKIKPNVKYNKAYEATKPLTEYLALVNQDDFLDHIEMIKQLTELVRRRVPDNVKDVAISCRPLLGSGQTYSIRVGQ